MDSISIHPGVAAGRRIHDLSHTAKPHKGGGKLAKKLKRLNQRQLDREQTIKTTKAKNAELAFKSPGSMNDHK